MTTLFDRDEANANPAMRRFFDAMRGSADDLRVMGLTVAVHNDYRLNGKPMTFWLMTHETGMHDAHERPIMRSYRGEGETDAVALDMIRAEFAAVMDDHRHAPVCPANHFHGKRAPTGPCTCGAIEIGSTMHGK